MSTHPLKHLVVLLFLLFETHGTHLNVMGCGVALCVVVAAVVLSSIPADDEVSLFGTVSYPVKSHVEGFGASLLHHLVDNAFGCAVVCGDDCWWLGVAHFYERCSNNFAFFSVVK